MQTSVQCHQADQPEVEANTVSYQRQIWQDVARKRRNQETMDGVL
jgi:hypothetical protein